MEKIKKKVYIRSSTMTIHKIWRVFNAETNELVDFWDRDERDFPYKKRRGLTREELRAVLESRGYEIVGPKRDLKAKKDNLTK